MSDNKKTYSVDLEGVVSRVYRVEAENAARAFEAAKREFVLDLGGNKDSLHVNDIWSE